MVGAADDFAVGVLIDQPRAPVPAHIVERPDDAVAPSDDEDRLPGQIDDHHIPRPRAPGRCSDGDPALGPDAVLLQAKEFPPSDRRPE